MESYPKELIEGVSPLIFAVDAILNKEQSSTHGNEKSSIFESFYNSIASKESINATRALNSDTSLESSSLAAIASSPSRSNRYFRFARGGSSSESPATSKYSFFTSKTLRNRKKINIQSSKKDFFSNAHIIPVSSRHAFPPSKDPHGNSNQNVNLNIKLFKSISSSSLMKRSQAVSNNINSVNELYALSSLNHKSVYNILKLSPIQGILPSGWIEKHVHALPSTLLFVTELKLHSSNDQQQQLYDQALLEQHLLNTVENITSSIAKKRDVPIHLVVLVQMEKEIHLNYGESNNNYNIGDKMILLHERMQSIKSVLRLNANAITLLPYFIVTENNIKDEIENDTDLKRKHAMKYNFKQLAKLQQVIYENSNLYYLTQVRRFKRKYSLLHHDKIYDLLPFAIRYCIKIAIFYEFQCSSLDSEDGLSGAPSTPFKEEEEEKIKREKSIKYWKEAYRHVTEYYHFLIEKEMQLRATDETFNGRKSSNVDESGSGSSSSSSSSSRLQQDLATPAHRDDENNGEILTPSKKEHISAGDEQQGDGIFGMSKEQTGLMQHPPSPPSPPLSSNSAPVQGGVEVALVYSQESGQSDVTIGAKTPLKTSASGDDDDKNIDKMTSRTHSEDMIHQCRAVADWINLKLLLVLSNAIEVTNDKSKIDSIVNLAHQIRKHTQVFLSKPMTLTYSLPALTKSNGKIVHLSDPTWYFWQFVAHQKQVFAEFLEQCTRKPTSVVLDSLSHDVSCQFSTAKHCMSSGEALLKVGDAIRKDNGHAAKKQIIESAIVDNRQRFVGSLAIFELQGIFDEERKRDHSDLALDAFKLASTEYEAEKLSFTEAVVVPQTNISYARLNQLIGGIYMQQGNINEATKHLEVALSYSKCFPTIHALLEKALIHCYKKLLSQKIKPEDKENQMKKLTRSTLDLILTSGINNILSKPALSGLFNDAFEISNKEQNQGDTLIEWPDCKDVEKPFEFTFTFPDQTHAIEGDIVRAILHLRSNLSTPVKLHDLSVISSLSRNLVIIDLENEAGYVLKPGDIKQITAKVTLQSNLSKAVDTKLVELQSLKAEKPRTAGLTSMGGGIYTDNKKRTKLSSGGLCVGCTALKIKFSSPNSEISSSVTIKILNSHRGTTPYRLNTKQSTIEEDNYIYSAWSRPASFPLSSGPRCLRVVCPQPDLEITDLTTSITNGRLIEGTVNRILLKLNAGPNENCRNVKLSVICSSNLEEAPPKSSSLLDREQSTEDATKLNFRKPILVEPCDEVHISSQTPSGWRMNSKNNGQGSRDTWMHVQDTLNGGSSTYAYFDLFRQLPSYEDISNEICRTNFLVTVTYYQVRKSQCEGSRDGDTVVQEYRGTAIWCSPMKAKISFLPATRKLIPSGIRHKGNSVSMGINAIPGKDSIALKSGSIAFMKCIIEAAEASNSLEVRLSAAKFEGIDNQPDLNVELINKKNDNTSNVIYSSDKDGICKKLNSGMKVSITFAARPSISENSQEEYISSILGTISLDWSPVPLQKLEYHQTKQMNDEFREYHGPLPVKNLQHIRYHCPSCHVEKTPFEASFKTNPDVPKVGNPFEVRYLIVNRTKLHQRLRVMMNDSESTAPSNYMLISGVINGEIILGPHEEKLLSYSLLVTKVGKVTIPSLDVSSVRYNTWIIHGSTMKKIFISP